MKGVTMKKFTKIAGVAIATFALVSGLALAGCSSSSSSASASASSSTSAGQVQLQIFAANSLQKALPEVQDLYTKANPNVTFADTQFEASGTLIKKLADAPGSADALITASKATMDTAENAGSIDAATRSDMFKNDLVICMKSGSDLKIASLEDLKSDEITSIAIGDPNVVPAGKYALQSLESAGLVTYDTAEDGTIENIVWDESISGKMNAGADKMGTVAKYVSGGQCQVGFVYTSDIYRYDGVEVAYTTDASSHKNILYPGAVVAGAKNAEVAADFLNFCSTNAEALKIFQKYGFELA